MMVAIEHWSLKKKKSAAENYKKNVYARACPSNPHTRLYAQREEGL